MTRILVVDDDAAIQVALRRALALDGYDVTLAGTGAEALASIRDDSPAAAILDWGLPDMEGVEVCRRIRAAGEVFPVVLLTARSEVGSRIDGLDAGADDYVAKPFDVGELLARVRAVLRRSAAISAPVSDQAPARRLTLADLVLNEATHSVHRAGVEIPLTRTEYRLLMYMLEHVGVVLGRERIMQAVWNDEHGLSSANLDAYVSHLRRKTEVADSPRLIHTVRGVGYVARSGE